jgi:hypothetical protein
VQPVELIVLLSLDLMPATLMLGRFRGRYGASK